MTMLDEYPVKCGICGNKMTAIRVCSTNRFGTADLDFRPPPMERDTLEYQISRCDQCGFAGIDIETTEPSDSDVMGTDRYRSMLQSTAPELAKSYACAALIGEGRLQHRDAGWLWLSGAWACDDQSSPCSKDFRIEAAHCIERAVASASEEPDFRMYGALVLIDLYRRAEQFDDALRWCESIQKEMESDDKQIGLIVAKQLKLIEARDHGGHQIPMDKSSD